MFEQPQIIKFGRILNVPREVVQRFPEEAEVLVEKTKEILDKEIEEYTIEKGLLVLNIDYTFIKSLSPISGDLELMIKAEVEVKEEI